MATDFETFDAAAIAAMPAFQQTVSGPDQTWVDRIASVNVGSGFRVRREEGETSHQVKRRVNAAAAVHYKLLMWKPEQTNLPEGQQPTSWVVKVKALDLKAKAEAEAKARQNAQSAPSQPQQPTETPNGTTDTPTTPAASGGPRNRPNA